ncbi:MAG: prepilin-type N-terminal cleavage/methylation domain-containing protein [Candidatus Omnitrophica bacterium]|nr:prepilin-type N-terminal cleavage/methylation domain-containing protein [Candidatus Omnitrophota bacterium]
MKGFSLIEIVICIGIVSIVAWAAFSVFGVIDRAYHWEMGMLELQQKVRPVIDGMLREIREGLNVTLADGGATITFNIPDVSNNITYYLSNNQIIRSHDDTDRIIASNIDFLCFCWDITNNNCTTSCSDNFVVRVEGTKTVRQKELFFNLTEVVRLRNP